MPRICTWGEFERDGKRLWFFNLHMDHIGVQARSESAKLVLTKIQEMCGSEPVILTDDFNVDQHNESYALLNNSETLDDSYELSPVCHAPNGTFNNYNPTGFSGECIDHIFVSPALKVLRYGILTDTYCSREAENIYVARTLSDHLDAFSNNLVIGAFLFNMLALLFTFCFVRLIQLNIIIIMKFISYT
ncbi:hypothetical protein Barb6_00809 [Bacteroidales bacterium Barb6]|nr:hypothetical protein Barb6_00809 [Bacteroidales bacterium Barb6]